MGKTLDMVEGCISDMLSESRDLKFAAVNENNNGGVERANSGLEPNKILVARVLEKRKNVFTNGLKTMMCGIITPTHQQKEMKWGAATHLLVTIVFSTLP